jgi:dienelactone hydrolase
LGGAGLLPGPRAGADLDGFVSFHGGLGTPDGQDYSATTAPVMLFHGSADPVSGMGDLASLLDQLQAAGVTHGAEVFGGARHSFTVYGSRDYDLAADQGSWAGLQDFLDEQL